MSESSGFGEHVTTNFEAHINQMERDRQQQQAEFERAQMTKRLEVQRAEAERSKARWQSMAIAVGWLSLAVAVVGVAYVIWLGVRGPSADDLIRQQDRQRCIEAGGTYFANPDAASGDIVCVMPGASTR